jgi:flagellar hook protein FlgE
MLSSLISGVSGLESFQQDMDVIGNNIANLNTTGFKAATVNFADSFSNTLQAPSPSSASSSGANSEQIGTGVTISSIGNNWTSGAASPTGIPSNLAISGNGFFVVNDPVSGASYATRDGDFSTDANGYLVTNTGERVQGFNNAGLSTLGSIQINTTGAPNGDTSPMTSFSIDAQGNINVQLADGTSFVRGQVLLQNFQDPQKLVNEGNNLYSNMSEAGPLSAAAAPDTNGLGNLQAGALELSNVDLSNEMANLITAQRAFEANSKIITTSDDVLQTLVNLKH